MTLNLSHAWLSISSSAKKKLLKFSRGFGYEIIPTWRMKNKPMTDLLSRIFLKYKIQCVLDVGANRGQYVDFLRHEVGYTGRIISFEPIPSNVQYLLQKSSMDPLWTICGFALGKEPGLKSFNVMELDVFSSFLRPSNSFIEEFNEMNTIRKAIEVEVKTLDDVFIGLEVDLSKTPTFIKLDTQGFDLEVIAGAANTLKRLSGLQSEISAIPIYDNMPTMLTSLSTFQNLGFQLAGMFPVSIAENAAVIEFDAISINTKI